MGEILGVGRQADQGVRPGGKHMHKQGEMAGGASQKATAAVGDKGFGTGSVKGDYG